MLGGESLVGIPLSIIPKDGAEKRWRGPFDQDIKPTKLWQSTGKVEVGETGPGCGVGCGYCNQKSVDVIPGQGRHAPYFSPLNVGLALNTRLYIGTKLDKVVDLDKFFEELKKFPHYDPEGAVLLENFNDPGMNWPRTLTVMNRLVDEMKHTGPMVFITKMRTPVFAINKMQDLQENGAKPIGIVTYSGNGMPRSIEPPNPKARIEGMKRLKNGGIPVIMAINPLVPGLNGTEDNIRETLLQTHEFVDMYTAGGLFIYPDMPGQPGTAKQFELAGHPLPEELIRAPYSRQKALSTEMRDMVRRVAAEEGITVPVSDQTSCAVDIITTTRYGTEKFNRMAYWVGKGAEGGTVFESKCAKYCPPAQMDVCKAKSDEDPSSVIAAAKEKLISIGFPGLDVVPSLTQKGQLLVVGGDLQYDHEVTVQEACGWDVITLPTEESVLYRSEQSLHGELGLDFEKSFTGAVLVGQEWYVFLNENNLDGVNNELALLHLRSKNRTRVKIVDASKLITADGIDAISDELISNTHGLQTEEEIRSQVASIATTYLQNNPNPD